MRSILDIKQQLHLEHFSSVEGVPDAFCCRALKNFHSIMEFFNSLKLCILCLIICGAASSADDLCRSKKKVLNFDCNIVCATFIFDLDTEVFNFKNCKRSEIRHKIINPLREAPISTMRFSNLGLNSLVMENMLGHKHLQILYADHNNLKELPKGIFADNKIEFLDLAFNQFTEIESIERSGARNLKTLNLSHNKITTLNRIYQDGLVRLETLDLSSNALDSLEQILFIHLINLKHLNLSHTNLLDFDFGLLSPLPQRSIQSLDISDNRIRKFRVYYKPETFQSLETIRMNANEMEDLNGLLPSNFPKLKHLDLRDNNFDCSHLATVLGSFDSRELQLDADQSDEIEYRESYRGLACDEYWTTELTSTTIESTTESESTSIETSSSTMEIELSTSTSIETTTDPEISSTLSTIDAEFTSSTMETGSGWVTLETTSALAGSIETTAKDRKMTNREFEHETSDNNNYYFITFLIMIVIIVILATILYSNRNRLFSKFEQNEVILVRQMPLNGVNNDSLV